MMGNYVYTITKSSSYNIPSSINSTSYEWLRVHSLDGGVSIADVFRLWTRFQQLGCSAAGIWTEQSAVNSSGKIGKNALLRKMIKEIHAPANQFVNFYEFMNASIWLERSSISDKLRACVAIINENKPINVEKMTDFLTIVFVTKSKQDIDALVKILFAAIGRENVAQKSVEISCDDFVKFLETNVPQRDLEDLFTFNIVPNAVKDNILSARNDRVTIEKFSMNSSIPTDKQLEDIVKIIGDNDYTKLSAHLGILEYDVSHLEYLHKGNREKIVLGILREWKLKEGSRAFTSVLKRALYLSGYNDIVSQMEFGQ